MTQGNNRVHRVQWILEKGEAGVAIIPSLRWSGGLTFRLAGKSAIFSMLRTDTGTSEFSTS